MAKIIEIIEKIKNLFKGKKKEGAKSPEEKPKAEEKKEEQK